MHTAQTTIWLKNPYHSWSRLLWTFTSRLWPCKSCPPPSSNWRSAQYPPYQFPSLYDMPGSDRLLFIFSPKMMYVTMPVFMNRVYFYQFCSPSLPFLQAFYVFLQIWWPNFDTVLQVWMCIRACLDHLSKWSMIMTAVTRDRDHQSYLVTNRCMYAATGRHSSVSH